MPKVSILMPVFNGLPFLEDAIESMLSQSFHDFECIIINDGSTDKSLDIINKYSSEDNRVKVISRPNKGLVHTLNEGLEIAQSPLIARMDADDISLPDRLAKQVKYMDINSDVACIGGQYDCIDYKGRLIGHIRVPVDDNEIQNQLLMGNTCICHPAAMMRRDVVIIIGGYNPEMNLAEDLDLYLRIGEKWKLGNLSETILRYRKHIYSISGESHKNQLIKMHDICKKSWSRRGIKGEFKNPGWLPTDKKSLYDFFIKCGSFGLKNKNRLMAIEYGIKAIKIRPSLKGGWKLIIKAIIGREN